MKCCMPTDVGTWTNWLTFELNQDYSPDAETDCFLRYRMRCNVKFHYVGNIPRRYWAPVAAEMRGFKMVLFTASRRNMCSTECPSSCVFKQFHDGHSVYSRSPRVLRSVLYRFLPHNIHSADYAVAKCLSVCPSHASVLSKRLDISSNFFHPGIATTL